MSRPCLAGHSRALARSADHFFMRRLSSALVILATLVAACEAPEDRDEAASPKSSLRAKAHPDRVAGGPAASTAASMSQPRNGQDATRDPDSLANHLHTLPDEALPGLLEAVSAKADPELRRELLTTLYEEIELRPAIIRLPLILEIARSEEVDPGLRTTILGELGATLHTDHGRSWADWSLVIEEHLATNHGLIGIE